MIVSIFHTKGGCGKTATSTLPLSAIAEFNSRSDDPLQTIALDTAPQGTLSSFFRRRAERKRPDFLIEPRVLNLHAKTNRPTNAQAHAILRDT